MAENLGPEFAIRVPMEIGKYKIIRTIGKGGYAIVVLAMDKKTQEKYAIKIVNRIYMAKTGMLTYLENELRLSSRFDHPNIVKVFEIIYEEDIISIVMEYVENGDLQTLLSQGVYFGLEDQFRIANELVSAIGYLHKRGISHRDIKPENILFDSEMHAKLIDFGLSKENASNLHTLCGTSMFIAPEIIKGGQYDGRKADIWSLGVTLHILNCSKFPFSTCEASYSRDVLDGHINIDLQCSPVLADVLKYMIVFEPEQRASYEELIVIIESTANKLIRSNNAKSRCRKTLPVLCFRQIAQNIPINARIKHSAAGRNWRRNDPRFKSV